MKKFDIKYEELLKLIHNHKNNTNKVNKNQEVEKKQLQQKESLLK